MNPEQFKFILELMRDDNANAVRVCLITGLRVGDVLALKRGNLTADGTITTVCDKTDKPFSGSIPAKLAETILFRAGGSDWVFPSPVARCKGKHRTRQAVWRDVKRAAKLCAVPRNVTPHSARKIYAVDQFRKKGIEEAQRSLQHDKLTTTLIYAFSDQLANEKEKQNRNYDNRSKGDRDQIDHRSKGDRDRVDQIMERFFEAFGGREYFADCVARLISQPGEKTTTKPKKKTASKK